MFRTALALAVAAFLFSAAPGQDKKTVETKKEEKKVEPRPLEGTKGGPAIKVTPNAALPGEVEIQLLNGSNVRMILQFEKLEVATAFGQLQVPATSIRAIEFGLHFPEGMEAKIDAAIKGLNADNFRDRDQATKALLELGPYSYPAVVEASRSGTLEVARRGKDLVKQMVAKHNKKDLKLAVEDRVVTPAFTIVGRIQNPTIKANGDLFGQVDFPIARIRTLRSLAGGGDIEVSIDAGKYANNGQWMDTEYVVDNINHIAITATGMVDTWPQQGGQYVVGPNGLQGRNMGMPFNGAVRGGKLRGPLNGQIYGGALIGRIGEDGEMFMIGERWEGIPEGQGKLYLHIGPSPWNTQCTGNYDVKIARK